MCLNCSSLKRQQFLSFQKSDFGPQSSPLHTDKHTSLQNVVHMSAFCSDEQQQKGLSTATHPMLYNRP